MDGSYKSRKFVLVLISCVLITLGWLAIAWLRVLEGTFIHFIAGITGLVALYLGVNSLGKSMVLKSQVTKTDEPPETDPPKKLVKKQETVTEDSGVNNGE